MGHNISWIGVSGSALEHVLSAVGLENTPAFAQYGSRPYSGHPLPDGWHLIVARGCDSELVSAEVLAKLSQEGRVIACSIEEHVMFCSAQFWQEGRCRWRVEHSPERSPRDLKPEGRMPASYDTLAQEAGRLQDADPQVDRFFDVPLQLAWEMCRFRHDETSEFLDYERFSVYSRPGNHRRWWQLWRSA